MVKILEAKDCICGVCQGGTQTEAGFYGGSRCVCQCHQKEMIPSQPGPNDGQDKIDFQKEAIEALNLWDEYLAECLSDTDWIYIEKVEEWARSIAARVEAETIKRANDCLLEIGAPNLVYLRLLYAHTEGTKEGNKS